MVQWAAIRQIGKMTFQAVSIGPLLLIVICGCGRDRNSQLRDSSAASVPLSSVPAGWRLCPNPEPVIGVVEGAPEYTFAHVGNATLLRDRTIVITDARVSEIRFFASNGRHLRTVGGKGRGPGEYRGLADLVRTSKDTLLVSDWSLNRITILDSAGRYVRSITVERPVRLLAAIDDTTLLIKSGWTDLPGSGLTRGTEFLSRISLRDGALRPVGSFPSHEVVMRRRSSGISMRGAPFARRTYAAGGDNRFYIGTSDRDEIRSYSSVGTPGAVIGGTREIVPVPRGGARKFYKAMYPERDLDLYFRRGRVGYSDAAPPTMPAFDGLLLDSEGYLWVRRYAPPWVRGPSSWDVHDPQGRLLGTVKVPGGRTRGALQRDLLEVGSDYALVLLEDSLDVHHVAKYRLLRGSGACD
ncbi:MAG: hypothetical protein ACT443_02215 [Gemmatimonadota bacterium]